MRTHSAGLVRRGTAGTVVEDVEYQLHHVFEDVAL